MDDIKRKELEKTCKKEKGHKVRVRMVAVRMVLVLDTADAIVARRHTKGCKPLWTRLDCVAFSGSTRMMSLTPTRIAMLKTFCQSAILDARTERIEWFWTKDISSARMRGSALVRHGSLDSQDFEGGCFQTQTLRPLR